MEDLKTRGTMAASRFLSRRGYEVLEEGWRSGAGECEVIALDGDVLAFVGGRTYNNSQFNRVISARTASHSKRISGRPLRRRAAFSPSSTLAKVE